MIEEEKDAVTEALEIIAEEELHVAEPVIAEPVSDGLPPNWNRFFGTGGN